MQPFSPLTLAAEAVPNVELLRRTGWSVATCSGDYCVAWRGRDEIIFQWRSGMWHRVGGRGGVDEL
jgi:hypothetical protein